MNGNLKSLVLLSTFLSPVGYNPNGDSSLAMHCLSIAEKNGCSLPKNSKNSDQIVDVKVHLRLFFVLKLHDSKYFRLLGFYTGEVCQQQPWENTGGPHSLLSFLLVQSQVMQDAGHIGTFPTGKGGLAYTFAAKASWQQDLAPLFREIHIMQTSKLLILSPGWERAYAEQSNGARFLWVGMNVVKLFIMCVMPIIFHMIFLSVYYYCL